MKHTNHQIHARPCAARAGRTTADIYSHAIRGKDREVAEMWDKIMQPGREASKSKVVN